MEKDTNKRISVGMTKEALVEFVLRSYYGKLSGIFSVVLGLIGVALFIMGYIREARYQAMVVYGFIAVLSLIGNPITLVMKARKQADTSPAYKKPIIYDISPDGLSVAVSVTCDETEESKELGRLDDAGASGEPESLNLDSSYQQEKLEWRHIYRLRLGRKMLAIHTSPVHAFVIPLSELGNDKDIVLSRLVQYTEPHKPHISGTLKHYRKQG